MKTKRANAILSPNYRNVLYHCRRLLQLHFNLDLPLYPFCFEDQIRNASNAWYDSPGVSFLMLVALESGESIYEIDGKKYTVSPGRFCSFRNLRRICSGRGDISTNTFWRLKAVIFLPSFPLCI